MDPQRSLIPLGVGIIMIGAAMLQPPWYVAVPFLITGTFLVAWGVFGDHIRSAISIMPGGAFVVRCMEKLEGITAGRDKFYEERKALFESIWVTLGDNHKAILKSMLLHGSPGQTTAFEYQQVRQMQLVQGDYVDAKQINPLFKDLIAEKIASEEAAD